MRDLLRAEGRLDLHLNLLVDDPRLAATETRTRCGSTTTVGVRGSCRESGQRPRRLLSMSRARYVHTDPAAYV
jgi:hypothetical protein